MEFCQGRHHNAGGTRLVVFVMRPKPIVLPIVASLAGLPSLNAQRPGGRGAGAEGSDTAPGVPAVERVATTQHTITIDGKPVPYTARAGTMVLHDSLGKP